MTQLFNNPSNPDAILTRVAQKGHIQEKTVTELSAVLKEAGYEFHLAVEVQSGALLKTLDNEGDARQTITNLRKKIDEGRCDYGEHKWNKVSDGRRCIKCKREELL